MPSKWKRTPEEVKEAISKFKKLKSQLKKLYTSLQEKVVTYTPQGEKYPVTRCQISFQETCLIDKVAKIRTPIGSNPDSHYKGLIGELFINALLYVPFQEFCVGFEEGLKNSRDECDILYQLAGRTFYLEVKTRFDEESATYTYKQGMILAGKREHHPVEVAEIDLETANKICPDYVLNVVYSEIGEGKILCQLEYHIAFQKLLKNNRLKRSFQDDSSDYFHYSDKLEIDDSNPIDPMGEKLRSLSVHKNHRGPQGPK